MIREKKLRNAVRKFAALMEESLAYKESQGYTGWDGEYDAEKLAQEIEDDARACTREGLMIVDEDLCADIANRAMMLWFQCVFATPAEQDTHCPECGRKVSDSTGDIGAAEQDTQKGDV